MFLLGGGGGGRIAGIPEATSEEGGSWGKHGFPHGSEPKASDGHAEYATRPEAIVARTLPFTVSPSSHEFTERERNVSSVMR